jgi:hypothetical protein
MRKILIIASLLSVALCIGGLSGGWKAHKFDADSNPIDKMALDAALGSINSENGFDSSFEFKGIEECKLQIVSGLKYRLTMNFQNVEEEVRQYEVIVYVVPWEKYVEVQSARDVSGKAFSADLAQNDVLREQVMNFVDEQVRLRVNRDLSLYELTAYRVVSMQVVQGNVYELRVEFRNYAEPEAAPVNFLVSVWSRPWLSPPLEITQITDYEPNAEQDETLTAVDKPDQQQLEEAQKQKQQQPGTGGSTMSGGYTERQWNGNGELEASALRELNAYGKEKVAQDFEVGAIKSAKSQIVAGLNLKITFDYFANGQQRSGEATVFLQPWRNFAQVTDFREL